MRQTAIQFYHHELAVDGVLGLPGDAPAKVGLVVVCHPHPLLGGNMDNPVVTAICRALDRQGIGSLRFDFRGVRGSEGAFAANSDGSGERGDGERGDLVAAMDAMTHWPGVDRNRLAVAGYSFGAGVALNAMDDLKLARGLALVAPPVSAVREMSRNVQHPILVVAGSRDGVSPSQELKRELDAVTGPIRFTEVPGADHSLAGHEEGVADTVAEFLVGAFGPNTPGRGP